jgi:hypothetical protein
VFEEVQQRFGARIEELVEAGQARGEIAPALPSQHLAFMVGCLLAGISVETAMGYDTSQDSSPEALRQSLGAMLRAALSFK